METVNTVFLLVTLCDIVAGIISVPFFGIPKVTPFAIKPWTRATTLRDLYHRRVISRTIVQNTRSSTLIIQKDDKETFRCPKLSFTSVQPQITYKFYTRKQNARSRPYNPSNMPIICYKAPTEINGSCQKPVNCTNSFADFAFTFSFI